MRERTERLLHFADQIVRGLEPDRGERDLAASGRPGEHRYEVVGHDQARRAGHTVLTLRGAAPRESHSRQPLCVDIDGFSLRAAVRVEPHDSKRLERLERLCRYFTRPALSDERVQLNAAG